MCNINVIYNKQKEEDVKINNLMNSMSYKSSLRNEDGEGYVSLNHKGMHIKRSMKKIIYRKLCYFLVTHQRLGTSGVKTLRNAHPHENKHFILIHNGVLCGVGSDEKKSDTKLYLEILTKEYKKTKDTLKAIRNIHKKKVNGSYSIVLYDKAKNKFIYYKNDRTTMYYIENRKYRILSTEISNVEYARNFLEIHSKIKKMHCHKIYDLMSFKIIGNIQKEKYYVMTTTKTKIEEEVSPSCINNFKTFQDKENERHYNENYKNNDDSKEWNLYKKNQEEIYEKTRINNKTTKQEEEEKELQEERKVKQLG